MAQKQSSNKGGSKKISLKGKGKYANYRAGNTREVNKMKRILDNNSPMALKSWTEKNETGFLLKRLKREKPTKFAKAMKNIIFSNFAKKFI